MINIQLENDLKTGGYKLNYQNLQNLQVLIIMSES